MYDPILVLHSAGERKAPSSPNRPPRTAFFCSACGREMSPLSSACGCGGGAVPYAGIMTTDSQHRTPRLRALVATLTAVFTRGA